MDRRQGSGGGAVMDAAAQPLSQLALFGLVCLGAFVLWLKMGWSGTHSIVTWAVNQVIPERLRLCRIFVDMTLFVAIGGGLGVVFFNPPDAKQAIVAGMGWTAILTGERQAARTCKGQAKP